MEPITPTIWSRLLTKRQRSSLSSYPVQSKTFMSSDSQGKEFFFNNALNAIPKEPQKKVKLEGNQIYIESPSTRVDENSPNLTACFSPLIRFNESLLGSPAISDIDRENLEEIQLDTEIQQENKTLKQLYEINKEITEIMEKKCGKLILEKEIYHEASFFYIQCSFNHIWETNLSNLRNKQWCLKCAEKYKKCIQFAQKKNWTIITEVFLPDLTFQCPMGHQITATYKNYEHKTSCSLCKKIVRQEYLEHLKEEEERIFQERLKTQERLFEESKRKAIEETQKPKDADKKAILEAYKQIQIEIEEKCVKYLNDYIAKKNADVTNFNKYLEVYKILMIPDNIFKLYMNSLDIESLKKEYRSLAKYIHPDKNNHPKAASAFQKLNKIYEECLGKVSPS